MEAVLQGEKGRVKVDYQWKTDLPNMHTLRKQTNKKNCFGISFCELHEFSIKIQATAGFSFLSVVHGQPLCGRKQGGDSSPLRRQK